MLGPKEAQVGDGNPIRFPPLPSFLVSKGGCAAESPAIGFLVQNFYYR